MSCTFSQLLRGSSTRLPAVLTTVTRSISSTSSIPTAAIGSSLLNRSLSRSSSAHAPYFLLPPFKPRNTYPLLTYIPNKQLSSSPESFLNSSSSYYVDSMYQQWLADPKSVHKSWDVYFQSGQYQSPPKMVGDYSGTSGDPAARVASAAPAGGLSRPMDSSAINDHVRLIQMIRAFQVRGHYMANLDPLGIDNARRGFSNPKELDLSYYGFSDSDLDRKVNVNFSNTKGFLSHSSEMTLREVHTRLTEAYSGTIGVQYMHIPDVEQCNWIREKFETPKKPEYPREKRLAILEHMIWADHFERFLAKKWATAKRFGLEGGEAVIPGMKALIDRCAELGAEACVMGMPHRGRLNVLSNILGKRPVQIFNEFAGTEVPMQEDWSGDVKYHMGLSQEQVSAGGKKVQLSLLPNPSHLEAVNPVVAGKVRAKQFYLEDTQRDKVVSVLLHGDAAFAGQGVVYETLGLADLPAYQVGGTIHLVVNNQIGFTTDPQKSRSTPYCTDIGKCVGAPIFHVNGDDPEAVVRVCEIAAEWRYRFKRDVIIDVVCYRKHGHNEIDEPSFTQPEMYNVIGKKKSTLDIYTQSLIDAGVLSKAEADAMMKKVWDSYEESYQKMKEYKPEPSEWLRGDWSEMTGPSEFQAPQPTGVKNDVLKYVGEKISSYPADFKIHPRLKGVYDAKKKMIETGEDLDWATGEALAFGTLLMEGYHVRLSGQDVERGTFSHRHAVLHDQENFEKPSFVHLQHLGDKQAPFSISNSNLSEFGVLGFEYGYSLENPDSLVLWEAQFGDFSNGAQVMIDQFISSGEAKWRRQSGIVMLLPHGYEGQGPEHSSARLERFLQNSSDHQDVFPDPSKINQNQRNNWQVLNCTTPANYFHALRRQIHRKFRKPLIVMSPKSLLRHRLARSTFADMAAGTSFLPVIPETSKDMVKDDKVQRVVFCSGKVYYDLVQHRDQHKIKNVALVRVEQLAPFPFDKVAEQMKRYSKAQVVWCQEEPMNQGAWTYVAPRFETASHGRTRPVYVGRLPAASPATGVAKHHDKEQHELVAEAFKL